MLPDEPVTEVACQKASGQVLCGESLRPVSG